MAGLLMWVMVLAQLSGMTVRADAIVQQNQLVLTLGADLKNRKLTFCSILV